jgi:hypothetical protein
MLWAYFKAWDYKKNIYCVRYVFALWSSWTFITWQYGSERVFPVELHLPTHLCSTTMSSTFSASHRFLLVISPPGHRRKATQLLNQANQHTDKKRNKKARKPFWATVKQDKTLLCALAERIALHLKAVKPTVHMVNGQTCNLLHKGHEDAVRSDYATFHQLPHQPHQLKGERGGGVISQSLTH